MPNSAAANSKSSDTVKARGSLRLSFMGNSCGVHDSPLGRGKVHAAQPDFPVRCGGCPTAPLVSVNRRVLCAVPERFPLPLWRDV
ncbi:hypothetical protein D3C71_1004490 [compost metagenome]